MTSSLDKFVTSDNKTTWTIIGIFGVVWFFALSSSDLIWGPDDGGVIIYDVPNITTLILEVGFGIIIGLIIFFLTKRSDIQNKKTLAKIESLISNMHKQQTDKKLDVENRIISTLANILEQIEIVKTSWPENEDSFDPYEQDLNPETEDEIFKAFNFPTPDPISGALERIQILIDKNLKNKDIVSPLYFSNTELVTFHTLIQAFNDMGNKAVDTRENNASMIRNEIFSLLGPFEIIARDIHDEMKKSIPK